MDRPPSPSRRIFVESSRAPDIPPPPPPNPRSTRQRHVRSTRATVSLTAVAAAPPSPLPATSPTRLFAFLRPDPPPSPASTAGDFVKSHTSPSSPSPSLIRRRPPAGPAACPAAGEFSSARRSTCSTRPARAARSAASLSRRSARARRSGPSTPSGFSRGEQTFVRTETRTVTGSEPRRAHVDPRREKILQVIVARAETPGGPARESRAAKSRPRLHRVKRRVAPTTSAASRGSSAPPPPREIVVVIFHVWNPPQKLADVASTAHQGGVRGGGVRGGANRVHAAPAATTPAAPRSAARRLATLAIGDGLRLFVLPVFHILGGDFEIVEFLLEAGQEGVARLGVVSFEVEGEVFAPSTLLRHFERLLAAVHRGWISTHAPCCLGRLDGGDALGARPDVLMRVSAAVGEAVRAKNPRRTASTRARNIRRNRRTPACIAGSTA